MALRAAEETERPTGCWSVEVSITTSEMYRYKYIPGMYGTVRSFDLQYEYTYSSMPSNLFVGSPRFCSIGLLPLERHNKHIRTQT